MDEKRGYQMVAGILIGTRWKWPELNSLIGWSSKAAWWLGLVLGRNKTAERLRISAMSLYADWWRIILSMGEALGTVTMTDIMRKEDWLQVQINRHSSKSSSWKNMVVSRWPNAKSPHSEQKCGLKTLRKCTV
ncbi:hypothetical protein DY000_02027114 [Brassica cretica]|uniref:DUF4283 domain-containing protein n=1 Tax=Brassica cretica TaxID=69181 RepID=A0ABQ7EL90_BRACR|nr:hypothetical protein DY000_02027114 [Brassica cretica]